MRNLHLLLHVAINPELSWPQLNSKGWEVPRMREPNIAYASNLYHKVISILKTIKKSTASRAGCLGSYPQLPDTS